MPTRKKAAKAPGRPARKAVRKAPARKAAAKRPRAARPAKRKTAPERETVEVRNVNVPAYRGRVDARRYRAMRDALLRVVPREGPGLTQAEMFEAAGRAAPRDAFPDGGKVAWWVKCVHLDLEARGIMARDASSRPLRWRVTA